MEIILTEQGKAAIEEALSSESSFTVTSYAVGSQSSIDLSGIDLTGLTDVRGKVASGDLEDLIVEDASTYDDEISLTLHFPHDYEDSDGNVTFDIGNIGLFSGTGTDKVMIAIAVLPTSFRKIASRFAGESVTSYGNNVAFTFVLRYSRIDESITLPDYVLGPQRLPAFANLTALEGEHPANEKGTDINASVVYFGPKPRMALRDNESTRKWVIDDDGFVGFSMFESDTVPAVGSPVYFNTTDNRFEVVDSSNIPIGLRGPDNTFVGAGSKYYSSVDTFTSGEKYYANDSGNLVTTDEGDNREVGIAVSTKELFVTAGLYNTASTGDSGTKGEPGAKGGSGKGAKGVKGSAGAQGAKGASPSINPIRISRSAISNPPSYMDNYSYNSSTGTHTFDWDSSITRARVFLRGGSSGGGGGGGGGGSSTSSTEDDYNGPAGVGGAGGTGGLGTDGDAGQSGLSGNNRHPGGGGGEGEESAAGGVTQVTINNVVHEASGGMRAHGGGGGSGRKVGTTVGGPGGGDGGGHSASSTGYGTYDAVLPVSGGGSDGGDGGGTAQSGGSGFPPNLGNTSVQTITGLSSGDSFSITVGKASLGGNPGSGGGGSGNSPDGSNGEEGDDGDDGWVEIIPLPGS